LALSRTQVDKLGDRLRRADVPTDDDLRLLSDFREERRGVMDAVGSGLAEIVGAVPARRLKTINSIVDKLRRESARLSQVQDIAGLRIVREMDRAEQDQLVRRIVAQRARQLQEAADQAVQAIDVLEDVAQEAGARRRIVGRAVHQELGGAADAGER